MISRRKDYSYRISELWLLGKSQDRKFIVFGVSLHELIYDQARHES